MRLTVLLYEKERLLGKYRVDTVQKTLRIIEAHSTPLFDVKFTYSRLVDYLKGRQVDFGRRNRGELLGYTYTAPDVWHEIAKTHGFDTDDYYWLSIPELNDEPFKLEDYHPRLSNFKGLSVYG